MRGGLIPSKLCACLVKPWPRKICRERKLVSSNILSTAEISTYFRRLPAHDLEGHCSWFAAVGQPVVIDDDDDDGDVGGHKGNKNDPK